MVETPTFWTFAQPEILTTSTAKLFRHRMQIRTHLQLQISDLVCKSDLLAPCLALILVNIDKFTIIIHTYKAVTKDAIDTKVSALIRWL